MSQPVILKFYLPTEVPTERVTYELEDGTMLSYEQYRKLVVPSKKNQKRAVSNKATGKAWIVPSEQYLKWKEEMLPQFEKFYLQALDAGVNLPIVRCNVTCLFYYPESRSRDNHNKFETIADMLVAADILADDAFTVIHETKLRGYCKRDKPRTEIYISILTPDMKEYEWDLTSAQYQKDKLAREAIQKRIQRAKAKKVKSQAR